MKILVQQGDYTFTAAAKTVSLDNYVSIDIENVLLITNLVDNIIIYNFADPTKGGTVAGNVLTLTYDTTTMSDTDQLQIHYWDNTANTPISGSVSISGSVPVTGPLTDTQLRTSPVPVSGTVTIVPSGTQTVSATNLDIRDLVFANDKVDVSGSILGANSGVDIGDVTINNASGAAAVNIQDGGNSITIDAVSLPLPTGASTLAEQQTQTTSLQLLDDTVATDGAATPTKGILIAGQDGVNAQTIKTDSDGNLQVDVLTMPSITLSGAIDTELPAPAVLADDTVNPTVPGVGSFPHVFDGSTWDRMPGTSADGILVNLGANNDVSVSSSALPSGAATAANQATIIGHVDGIEPLLATIDADTSIIAGAVSGNEMQVFDSQGLAEQQELAIIAESIQELVSRLDFLPSVRGIAADLRVTLLSGVVTTVSTVTTVTTVSTVTSVTTLANQTNMGGFSASALVQNNQNNVAINSNINNIL